MDSEVWKFEIYPIKWDCLLIPHKQAFPINWVFLKCHEKFDKKDKNLKIPQSIENACMDISKHSLLIGYFSNTSKISSKIVKIWKVPNQLRMLDTIYVKYIKYPFWKHLSLINWECWFRGISKHSQFIGHISGSSKWIGL